MTSSLPGGSFFPTNCGGPQFPNHSYPHFSALHKSHVDAAGDSLGQLWQFLIGNLIRLYYDPNFPSGGKCESPAYSGFLQRNVLDLLNAVQIVLRILAPLPRGLVFRKPLRDAVSA